MWYSPCSSPESGELPLEEAVRQALKKLTKDEALTEEGVAAAWEKAAGCKAARHSRPASFKGGRLVVEVDASSWLYELTLEKKAILKRLGGKFAGKKIKEIGFRIGEVWEKK